MTADRDQLQSKVEELEKKSKLPTLSLNLPLDDDLDSPSSPVPPPRSPYRQNTTKERSQLATVESLQIASPEDPDAPRESFLDTDAQLFAKYHQSSRPSRDSMLPPARLIPEHDVSLRAASPPPPRTTYRSPSPVDMNSIAHDSIRESTLGMSDYEDLPTPPPKAISHVSSPPPSSNNIFSNDMIAGICIKVTGSNITTNEKGKEVVSFIISVGKRIDLPADVADDEMEELWRVEKLYSDFLALDTKVWPVFSNSLPWHHGPHLTHSLFSFFLFR